MDGENVPSTRAQPDDGVPEVDTSAPNVARMYDYYLGGSANFAVDRDAAERALAITPENGSAVTTPVRGRPDGKALTHLGNLRWCGELKQIPAAHAEELAAWR